MVSDVKVPVGSISRSPILIAHYSPVCSPVSNLVTGTPPPLTLKFGGPSQPRLLLMRGHGSESIGLGKCLESPFVGPPISVVGKDLYKVGRRVLGPGLPA